MPVQTAKEYYENPALHGGYAFNTLKEIIDELLIETLDEDGYLVNTPRSKLVQKAKDGIQVLNRQIKKNILSYEITIGPKLYIPLPQDFIDFVRVSVVTPDFRLKPLRVNNNIPTAVGYLQDNNYELLFDDAGSILMADSINIYNKPVKQYFFCDGQSGYGNFVVDIERGVIGFSQELENKEVVLEYISDGLQMFNLSESEIRIHKSLKQVLMEYVYLETIRKRRSVPRNEKAATLARYKALLHRALIDNLKFNIVDLYSLNFGTSSRHEGNSVQNLQNQIQTPVTPPVVDPNPPIEPPVADKTVVFADFSFDVTAYDSFGITAANEIFMARLQDPTESGKITYPDFRLSTDGRTIFLKYDWSIPQASFSLLTYDKSSSVPDQVKNVPSTGEVTITASEPIFLIQFVDPENNNLYTIPDFVLTNNGMTASFVIETTVALSNVIFRILPESILNDEPSQTVTITKYVPISVTATDPIFLVQLIDPTDGSLRTLQDFRLSNNDLTATFTTEESIPNALIKFITK